LKGRGKKKRGFHPSLEDTLLAEARLALFSEL